MAEICHVTTAHLADDVRVADRECRSLAAVPGYRVTLLAAGKTLPDLPVRHLEIPPASENRFLRIGSANPRAEWALLGVKADVWHFHDLELLPLAIGMAKAGRAVIWDSHEDYFEQLESWTSKEWIPESLRGIAAKGTNSMLRAIDRHAAAIVAATDVIAARYNNPRTVVVGNETRIEDFAECRPSADSRQLLFTGAAGAGTCFGEVVEAVEGLPDLTLAVAGSRTDPAFREDARRRLGSRFVELGWLDRQGLRDAIAASVAGFVTYADRQAFANTSPNKIFEFSAAGLPVICTPNPKTAERIRSGGFGVAAADFTVEGIRQAIAAATTDPAVWQDLSDHGRKWSVEHGSWAVSERVLLDTYASVLADR